MYISYHAGVALTRRGLTVANVNWCVAGNNYFVQPNNNRHYTRDYDAGQSTVHVLTSNDGGTLVTAWIRGRLDPGV